MTEEPFGRAGGKPHLISENSCVPSSRRRINGDLSVGQMSFFRLEGRGFPVGRCLVAASFFYEFAGPGRQMEIREDQGGWFCFARLWRPMAQGGEAFTLLTTDPSPDVAPIYDRQMVILERADWSAWLQQTGNEKELLRALLAGSLEVDQVRA